MLQGGAGEKQVELPPPSVDRSWRLWRDRTMCMPVAGAGPAIAASNAAAAVDAASVSAIDSTTSAAAREIAVMVYSADTDRAAAAAAAVKACQRGCVLHDVAVELGVLMRDMNLIGGGAATWK